VATAIFFPEMSLLETRRRPQVSAFAGTQINRADWLRKYSNFGRRKTEHHCALDRSLHCREFLGRRLAYNV